MKPSRSLANHSQRLAMVSNGHAAPGNIGQYTYPKGSKIINPRHFYQNTVLLDWANKDPRPISLRQLAFFGRRLTSDRIISSANFVRQELPVRLAHRIRDMQRLPFAVMSNKHLGSVYELYYIAFDQFRKTPVISDLKDNEKFCEKLNHLLQAHVTVIPQLAMGVIETSDELIDNGKGLVNRLDQFVGSMLSSRISRRVIAEQHISLTKSLESGHNKYDKDPDFIGEVFLQCSATDTIKKCHESAKLLISEILPNRRMPDLILEGHLDATFPYIPAHLEYIIGEIMRNSVEATVRHHDTLALSGQELPPILVSISNTPQNVYLRISDQGGGIPKEMLPYIWSFSKQGSPMRRIDSFKTVPRFQGVSGEVNMDNAIPSSLGSLATRPPDVKLGMGLPLSRVYAEYWDGSLELHNLEDYGCDVSLKISRLGNNIEKLQLDHV